MGTRTRHIAGSILIVFALMSATPAWASGAFSITEQYKFTAMVWTTILSAGGTALVSLYHFFKKKAGDWSVLLHSAASILLVTLFFFFLSVIPLLEWVDVTDAFRVVFLPSVIMGVMLVASALWIRNLLIEQKVFRFENGIREEARRLRRLADNRLRDWRIQRTVAARRRRLAKR